MNGFSGNLDGSQEQVAKGISKIYEAKTLLNYVLSMALSLNDGPVSRIGAELLSPAINEHPSGPIEVHERNIKNLSLQKSPNYRKAKELVHTLSRNE